MTSLLTRLLVAALTASTAGLGAATYTVTATADSGAGSLREAIESANANPGADTIDFNIPGGGLQRIALASPLPTATGPTVIDGTTQPGWVVGTPAVLVEYDDEDSPSQIVSFGPLSDGSTLRAIAIIGRTDLLVNFQSSDNSIMQGCWLGIDPAAPTGNRGGYRGAFILDSDTVTVGGPNPGEGNRFGNCQFSLALDQCDDAVVRETGLA